jgi:hypothetical protein
MPQRHEAHVNEERSRRAFVALFDPDPWVIRPLDQDYGRDLEVELFDQKQPTGQLFAAQLKSIDKPPRSDGTISKSGIPSESVLAWQRYDYPIMVALFSVPTREYFYRWAHTYDWHAGAHHHKAQCTEACGTPPATVTFAYGPSDRLTSDVVDSRLADELRFLRSARQGDLRNQLLPVRIAGEGVEGHSIGEIREAAQRIGSTVGKVRVVEDPETPAVDIYYSAKAVRATLPVGFRSITLHLLAGLYVHRGGAATLAADGLVAAAWLFHQLKADHTAADLFAALAPFSKVLFDSDLPSLIVEMLEDCGRVDVLAVMREEERRRSS